MADVIEAVFRATSPEEFQRALRGAATEARALDDQAKKTAGSTQRLDQALSTSSLKLNQVGQALTVGGSLLSSFAAKGDETSKTLATLASKAGMVVTAFATTGPWGAAITAATLAIGTMAEGFMSAKTRAEELTRALEEQVPRIRAAQQAAAEADAVMRRIGAGAGTSAEITRQIEALGERRDRRESVIAPERERLLGLLREAREREAQKESVRKRAADAQSRSGSRSGGVGDGIRDELEGQVRDARATRAARGGRQLGTVDLDAEAEAAERRQAEQFESFARIRDEVEKLQQEIQTAVTDASNTFRDSWRGSIDDVIEAFEKYNRVASQVGRQSLTTADLMIKSAKQAGNTIADQIGDTATGALRANIEAWADGEQTIGQAVGSIVKTVVKGVAIESGLKALFEFAEGWAALAGYRYDAAAGHFTAAGIYGAVAGAAGAAGAAMGAFGGGGGAAAGGAGGPARPVSEESSQQRREPQTVVINLNAPNLVAMDRASQGRFIEKVRQAGLRGFSERAA